MSEDWQNWAIAQGQQGQPQPQPGIPAGSGPIGAPPPSGEPWQSWQTVPQASQQAPPAMPGVPQLGTEDYLLSKVTGGLTDKAGSAAVAIAHGAPGESFGERYHNALSNFQGQESGIEDKSAGLKDLGGAAGILGPFLFAGPAPGAVAAPTLAGRAAQAAGAGATIGGVEGFAHAPDTSLLGDVVQTGAGAGAGAALGAGTSLASDLALKPIADWFTQKIGGTNIDTQAANAIFERIRQDQKAGGPSAQDMLDLLKLAPNKPQTIADVGGENVQALAGNVYRYPGESRQVVSGFLGPRDAAAGGRLASDVDTGISSGGTAHDTTQALIQARSTAAKPLYEQAYAANQNMASPELDRILATPAGQSALKTASVMMRNDGGNVPLDSLPHSLRGLDYVKGALDDQIGSALSAGNKRQAGILIGLKNNLLGELDKMDTTGAYAQARSAFAGPSASIDAVKEGSQLFSKSPSQIAGEVSDLSPGEKEFYKLGAADAIKTKISRTGMAGDEARAIAGSDWAKSQVRPLFDSDAEYDKFMNSVAAEQRMFKTNYNVMGNSKTAARVAEDQHGISSFGGPILQMGSALASGDVPNALLGGGRLLNSFRNFATQPSPEVNAAIARSLFNPDMSVNQSALARILSLPTPKRIPVTTAPLSALAGAYLPKVGANLLTGGQAQ